MISCACGRTKDRKAIKCRECYRVDGAVRVAEALKCPDCDGAKDRYAVRCRTCSDSGGFNSHYQVLPVREPSEAEMAWVAGLYEGEGSTAFHGGSFVLLIPQKDPEILYRLPEMYGGAVSGMRKHGVHVWQISGRQAARLAEDMWPWLSERRRTQIDVVWPAHLRSAA